MRYKTRTNTAGFTIVETLIVLAIAGLILLIVFEAIPALVRSSRNDQRRQDVNYILAEVSHYELNNSGNMPQCGSGSYGSCYGSGAGFLLATDKLSYYNVAGTSIKIYVSQVGDTGVAYFPATIVTNTDTVLVFNHAKCGTSTAGSATPTGAGYNDVVALYAIESGGNSNDSQCQEL